MASLGELVISIKANTVEFTDGAGNCVAKLRNMGDESEKVGKKMTSSMGEARGGLMLTEHLLGVPLPRHLNSLIAQIPGVGAAFATMLPIVGVLLAVEIIGKLIAKHEELAHKIREAAESMANVTVKQDDQTNSLILQNLKLDDQIAKLEGRPSKNALEEALIKAHDAVDKLASGFAADFVKIDGILFDATTLTHKFMEGLRGGHDITALVNGIDGIQKPLGVVNAAMAKLNETRMHLADAVPGSEEEKSLTAELAKNYGAVETAAKAALQAANDYGSQDKKLIGALTEAVITAGHAVQDLKLVEAQPPKEQKIDDLTKRAKAYHDELSDLKAVRAAVDEHSAALRKQAQTQAEIVTARDRGEEKPKTDTSVDENTQKEIASAELTKESAIKAADDVLETKRQIYNEELKDASKTAAEIKTLGDVWKRDVQQNTDAVTEIGLEYEKRSVSAYAAGEREKRELAKEAARERQALEDETLRTTISDIAMAKAATMESVHTQLAEHEISAKRALTLEIQAVKDQVNADKSALDQRIANLDRNNAEQLKKIQKFEAEKKKIEQKGNLEITKLDNDAEKSRIKNIETYEKQFNQSMAKCIVTGKGLGSAMKSMAEQMTEAMIMQLLKYLEKKIGVTAMIEAVESAMGIKSAAQKAAEAVATQALDSTTGTANAGLAATSAAAEAGLAAPEVAAETFATVEPYAFMAHGGQFSGYGGGDRIPTMLEAGESVVTKELTRSVAQSQGGSNGGGHVIQHSPTYNVSTMDSRGFSSMLQKHDAEFQAHAVATMRKLNMRAGRG